MSALCSAYTSIPWVGVRVRIVKHMQYSHTPCKKSIQPNFLINWTSSVKITSIHGSVHSTISHSAIFFFPSLHLNVCTLLWAFCHLIFNSNPAAYAAAIEPEENAMAISTPINSFARYTSTIFNCCKCVVFIWRCFCVCVCVCTTRLPKLAGAIFTLVVKRLQSTHAGTYVEAYIHWHSIVLFYHKCFLYMSEARLKGRRLFNSSNIPRV